MLRRRFSPEETLAALTSQGMEVVACSPVPTHCAVPRLVFPTGHGFRYWGGCRRPLNLGGVSSQLWTPLDIRPPFCRASPQTYPGPDPLHYLHFIAFNLCPPRDFLPAPLTQHVACRPQNLVLGSSPETPPLTCFPLDFRSCLE